MKALQKNQGRTDQMLGAMADVLTSVAMPNQHWVSCKSVCVFLMLCESKMAQIKPQTYTEVFFRKLRGMMSSSHWGHVITCQVSFLMPKTQA